MKRNRIIRSLAVLAFAVLAFALPASAQDDGFSITILHTNDVHARIDQFDGRGNICDEDEAAEGGCFGGVARRKTAIDAVRADVDNVVLLDGGDQFQGTLFYNQYKGIAAREMMNVLGYDAMAVGNHEFDDGPGNLANFIDGADFAVLSANIDASADPELDGLIQPYTILDINGQQVGVVGFTTEDTAILSSPGDVVFTDIETAVQAAIDELTAQGINIILGVSHTGFAADMAVAMGVTGLDVIVSGHTNTFLSNVDEDATGPYPTVVEGADGDPVLLVSSFAWGKYLGRLDVTFDSDGIAASYEGEPIHLDASVEQDAQLQARVDELAAPLNELLDLVVGQADGLLDGDRANCRFGECTMGNLITDAILWSTASEGVQIALQNGGGIRASIEAGEVTAGEVLGVLPFGNLISTFDLSGEALMAALENGVSVAENPDNEGTGRFLQVAGVRFAWDAAMPAGERIISAEVRNADGSYSPVDMAATYKVAANDFIRNGGDGYSMFVDAANAYDFGELLDVAVSNYIAENGPVAPELDGRITRSDSAEVVIETAAEEEEEAAAPSGGGTYIVQKGDTLSGISLQFYGTANRWGDIFEANRDKIKEPHWIQPGQELVIP